MFYSPASIQLEVVLILLSCLPAADDWSGEVRLDQSDPGLSQVSHSHWEQLTYISVAVRPQRTSVGRRREVR